MLPGFAGSKFLAQPGPGKVPTINPSLRLTMTLRLVLLAGLIGVAPVTYAQTSDTVIGESTGVLLSEREIEDLVAPIALHPDALVALILPAATQASDIVLAARRLAVNSNPAGLDEEPWDDAVQALARYPEIIQWMDENLAWTKRLGDAFQEQPDEVMEAIQSLRARARASGTLADTPQQRVVMEEEEIRIVPAQPEVIYVPRYEPEVVYVERPVYYPSTYLTFGLAYPVGWWLAYDCDWRHRTVWVAPRPDRHRIWHQRRDWVHRGYSRWKYDDCWETWRPRPRHGRPHPGGWRGHSGERIVGPHGPGRGRGDFRPDGSRQRVSREQEFSRGRPVVSAPAIVSEPYPGIRDRDRGDDNRSRWRENRHQRELYRGPIGGRRGIPPPSDLPGGRTPTPAPPVASVPSVKPAVPVSPTVNPAVPAQTAPRFSPQNRRLATERSEPREFMRLPNGRLKVAPNDGPSAPRPERTFRSERPMTQAPASRPAMQPSTSRPITLSASSRPDFRRAEAPRQVRPEGGGRPDFSQRSHRVDAPGRADSGRGSDSRAPLIRRQDD